MQWLIRFFVHHRNIASLCIMVFVSMWMLSSDPMKQQRITRTLTLTVFYPFQFYFNQTTRIKNIFAENRKLKEEIASLSVKVSLLSENASENDRLTDLLGISKSFPYAIVPARVVARDPSFVSKSAVINVGRDKGLVAYMPVVTSRGIAGKIIQVMAHMSLVQLVIDPSNRTSVLVRRTREIGILETENGADFFIMFRAHADVAAQDTLITSGFGGIYPKGLIAGIVEKVPETADPLFKKAIVRPLVDFDRMEEAFVIRMAPQWAAFKSELDSLEAGRR